MMSSWLDFLPSHEKAKIKQKLRSPAAYAALREKVKGPQDLEKELRVAEQMAELNFAMETEPKVAEALKQQVEQDIAEKGIEQMTEVADLSPDAKSALEQGNFSVSIEADPESNQDAIAITAEGNVSEKLMLKKNVSDNYAAQLTMNL